MSEENRNQTEEQTQTAAEPAPQESEPKKEPRGEKNEKKKAAQLEERLKTLEEESARLDERYKRVLAEYDNFRKRTQKERETLYQDAQMAAISGFLPVLDNLERGAAQEGADEGLKMIAKQFQEILTKYRVEPCGAEGEAFDPNFHNAVMHEEGEGGETVIAQVLQKGYTMNGRLLRAAMVKTTG